ncbi:MAG: class I SAM-dependent RNA methyltransferase [Gemmatimonadales bacterium]|nr:class I SAM-dependent RNA methyltransferase [Gemmatimonadales bacterium]
MAPSLFSCFAITAPGIEGLTRTELEALGLSVVSSEPGGVAFEAPAAALYAANLHLRTANRIIVRLAEFPARAFYELERKAKRVPWGEVVAPGTQVRFRVTSRKSRLYHEDGIAERVAGAIPGAELEPRDAAPGPEGESGAETQLFVVRVVRDMVTISADSSGELLHRRGYRLATAKAPLRETLAAAMLLGAGYDGSEALIDPFAGAGTIPIEAAMLARRMAPGLRRRFAFERWPSFDAGRWASLRDEAEARVLPRAPAPIVGGDLDAGAIRAAGENAARAGVLEDIEFRAAAFDTLTSTVARGYLVTNPPYGRRIAGEEALSGLFQAFGAFAREQLPGFRVAFLSPDPELDRATGLPLSMLWQTENGGIPVRLVATPTLA